MLFVGLMAAQPLAVGTGKGGCDATGEWTGAAWAGVQCTNFNCATSCNVQSYGALGATTYFCGCGAAGSTDAPPTGCYANLTLDEEDNITGFECWEISEPCTNPLECISPNDADGVHPTVGVRYKLCYCAQPSN